jgi:multiple sugar transport system ATP-binding protein
MVLSDRIAVMHAGRVRQCASPREIYRTPADLTVAELVGSPAINCLDVEVREKGFVLPNGEEFMIPPNYANGLLICPGGPPGIRPEHANHWCWSGKRKSTASRASGKNHVFIG